MLKLEEIPTTLEQGRLQRTNPKLLVASGLTQGAKISTYIIKSGAYRQLSVFVYPSTITLNSERVLSLDSEFDEIQQQRITKEFRDLSVEELDHNFLEKVKPLYPFMSNTYTLQRTQIIENSFDWGSSTRIEDVIANLK